MSIVDKLKQTPEYLAKGIHVIQPKPSMHRLSNVIGMCLGFVGFKYFADIMFGHTITNSDKTDIPGNKYRKIKAEDVPIVFRWLHGIVEYNPFSDDPKDQWLKATHQMIPAIGGAVGAVAGSAAYFGSSYSGKRADMIKGLMDKASKGETLTPVEANAVSAFEQGGKWRLAAGATAWLSAASGLTFLYGVALNTAFWLQNGGKTLVGAAEYFGAETLRKFANITSNEGLAPDKALAAISKEAAQFLEKEKAGNPSNEKLSKFGERLAMTVFAPLFKKLTPEDKQTIVGKIQTALNEAYKAQSGQDAATIQKEITGRINGILKDTGVQTLSGGMVAGNNGWLGQIGEFFGSKRIEAWRKNAVNSYVPQEINKGKIAAIGAGVVAGGAAIAAMVGSHDKTSKEPEKDAANLTAEEYVKSKQESAKPKGFINGTLLGIAKWFADSALAVVPVHRMWCAISLTASGFLGLQLANLTSGKNFADWGGAATKKEDFFKFLQPLYGVFASDEHKKEILKDAPNKIQSFFKISKDNHSKLIGMGIYAATMVAGVIWGSKHAYDNVYRNNREPKSLEDFISKVRTHQGDSMILPTAVTSLFASSSGYSMLPIPGVNFATTIALRTTAMQDRNMQNVGKPLNGTVTNSYLSLREGIDYVREYATYSPQKELEDLPYLAHTILGPLANAANVTLTGEHIKSFVDKVNKVRDKYFVEGGIKDKEVQLEFMKEMETHFSGKGLDKTLYDIGIDTLQIRFDKIGGMLGKFANSWVPFLNKRKEIAKEQDCYHKIVEKWRKDWKTEEVTKAEPAAIQEVDAGQKKFADTIKSVASKPLEDKDLKATQAIAKVLSDIKPKSRADIKETSLMDRSLSSDGELSAARV
ncbi:MAG: hypothetical protein WCL30_01765 [Pseudomonadota bacterium]